MTDSSQQPHHLPLSRRPSHAPPLAPAADGNGGDAIATLNQLVQRDASHAQQIAELHARLAQSDAQTHALAAQLQALQSPGAVTFSPSPSPSRTDATLAFAHVQAMALAAGARPLDTFEGDSDVAGLKALAWVQGVELAFESHQLTFGAALTDEQKQAQAMRALRGNALGWYQALATKPVGWPAFRTAFLGRWQMASSTEVLEKRLTALAHSAAALRKPLSHDGLHRFAAQSAHGLRLLLSVGERCAECELVRLERELDGLHPGERLEAGHVAVALECVERACSCRERRGLHVRERESGVGAAGRRTGAGRGCAG